MPKYETPWRYAVPGMQPETSYEYRPKHIDHASRIGFHHKKLRDILPRFGLVQGAIDTSNMGLNPEDQEKLEYYLELSIKNGGNIRRAPGEAAPEAKAPPVEPEKVGEDEAGTIHWEWIRDNEGRINLAKMDKEQIKAACDANGIRVDFRKRLDSVRKVLRNRLIEEGEKVK